MKSQRALLSFLDLQNDFCFGFQYLNKQNLIHQIYVKFKKMLENVAFEAYGGRSSRRWLTSCSSGVEILK